MTVKGTVFIALEAIGVKTRKALWGLSPWFTWKG